MNSASAVLPRTSDPRDWTEAEKAVVTAAGLVFRHAYGAREGEVEAAPRPVVEKFLHVCRTTGLDPLTRQIYCIGRFSRGEVEWSIQTSIDGFRVIAERSQKYAGQDEAEWLTETGEWVPVFVKALHGPHPLAARVRVYRHDWTKPATGIATWDEYAQTKRNGELTDMWNQRGPGQLAKCAEALALRKAFPQDLSGLYTGDEMDKVNAVEPVDAANVTSYGDEIPDSPSETRQAPRQQPNTPERAPEGGSGRQQAQIASEAVQASQEWVDRVANVATGDEALEVYREGRLKGVLAHVVEIDGRQTELGQWIIATGEALRKAEIEAAGAHVDGQPAVLDETAGQ